MSETEILAKLAATFAQEGLIFEPLGRSEQRLLVRARRTGPGAPVALMVKALAGTLRRYHPELREVELVEYDPGQGFPPPPEPSPDLALLLKHQGGRVSSSWPSTPGLDLSGLDRAQAIQALEQAHRLWSRQGLQRFRLKGLQQDPARRALNKWLSFYNLSESCHEEQQGEGVQIVLRGAPPQEFPPWEETLWFPGRLMLTNQESP